MLSSSADRKGKGREIPLPRRVRARSMSTPQSRYLRPRYTEGDGGADGIVLPLQYIQDGPFDVSYTLPILIGADDNIQNLSVQVDTGSSDLWFASSSCGSPACSSTSLYAPGPSAIPTGDNFSIPYLEGSASGPIYWDTVTVGGYSIGTQAFAAADQVTDEPLGSLFSGVLGLALPANSIIAGEIQPGLGDAPDGAVWASNLFSITPADSAPSAPFLSLALERPGSSAVPSVLGIGRHPAVLVPDPSRVAYDELYQPEPDGPHYWKAAVRSVTVYTNSSRMPISVGRGASGTAFPSAVLDTGMPVILTTTAVANAIYGALGIGPAADNMYYVPCKTPINMTFSLDDREEIPLHPLDLTAEPSATAADQSQCLGLIQTSASDELSNPESGIGDMVLGVPFMRNVYTVLAYDIPASNGTFPVLPINDSSQAVRPRLGLLGLTNATVALEEFYRVRVLNQPLGDGASSGNVSNVEGGGKKQNVGIDVLIALGSFVGLCVLLFGLRWFFMRRHLRRMGGVDGDYDLAAYSGDAKNRRERAAGAYRDTEDGLPSEDELRKRRFSAYMQSMHTVSTDRTQIEPISEVDEAGNGGAKDKDGGKELLQVLPQEQEPPVSSVLPLSPHDNAPLLLQQQSVERVPVRHAHGRPLSVSVPLLPEAEAEAGNDHDHDRDFGVLASPASMAGIGTASFARGRQSSASSIPTPQHARLSMGSPRLSSSRSPAPSQRHSVAEGSPDDS